MAGAVAGRSAERTAEWHHRFSRFALRAFLVVTATGIYQAVLYLPSPQALLATEYGRVLIGKHVFVAGVLALAGLNRFVIGPALRRGRGALRRRALAVVRAEAACGVLVIAAAVLLAATSTARPPADVFHVPAVMEQMAERRQVVRGDREGWELVIIRRSSNRHEFRLRTPGDGLAEGTLLLEGPGAGTDRRLALRPDGAVLAAEALVLSRDGRWRASFSGSPRQAVFTFEMRAGHVLPFERPARALWDGAIAETERRMPSARMIDILTDGLSLMLFAHHDFVAPDRWRLEILGRREMITVGEQRFSRQFGADWEAEQLGLTFRWPEFSFLERAIGVRAVGSAVHGGQEVIVLAGYDPGSRVGYEIWVGRQDLIHRVVMGVPGHYMINAYYEINAPIAVQTPFDR